MSEQYYASLNLRATAAVDCSQLQQIANQITGSLNFEISAINAVISNVTGIYNTLLDIQATIAALTGSATSLTGLPASAAGLTTLGSVIVFCQAQATVLASLGTTMNATIVKSLIRLVNDISMLESQINALNTNLTVVTEGLSNFEDTVTGAASRFPHCTITLP